MSDYEDYDNYENDVDEDIYESDMENDDEIEEEKEQYIDINEVNDNNNLDDEDEDLEIINETIIMNSENIKTTKYLTLYEKTGIIAQRAEELSKQYEKDDFLPL
ncbi:hypothetical protein CU098_008796, partial [Rhizopus stolonifer]